MVKSKSRIRRWYRLYAYASSPARVTRPLTVSLSKPMSSIHSIMPGIDCLGLKPLEGFDTPDLVEARALLAEL
jgi:hypothetical protein